MRNGWHWPSSGGRPRVGKSVLRVCERSTTRTPPPCSALASWPSGWLGFMSRPARGEFTFEHLGVVAPARQPVLRDVARIDILHAALQRLDDGAGHGLRRQ